MARLVMDCLVRFSGEDKASFPEDEFLGYEAFCLQYNGNTGSLTISPKAK
jgi:hypothetical protein